jgi:uncharacterized membrane protein YkoI
MLNTIGKAVMAVAALAALALGGSVVADAADNGSTTSSNSSAAQQGYGWGYGPPPNGAAPGGGPAGGHVGKNGRREEPLTGDTAAKVKKAALDKVPGGTVERVETDVDHGSPYEAHVRKSDGTELEVLVNRDFEVTAVNTMTR